MNIRLVRFRIGEHSVTVATAAACAAVLLLDHTAHTFGARYERTKK